MRLLVVDDEVDVTLILGEALRDRGHVVEAVSSGHEALRVATAFRPDAALVDVGLPDIDGITLAGLIRGAVGDKRVRIVAFSGWGESRLRGAIQRDVFDDYLLKPASLDAIEHALAASAGPASPPPVGA
jgi:CheY-like chemotaxis protein